VLTNSDLQSIGDIIDRKVPHIVKKELKPIEKRLSKIEKVISEDFNFLDRLHIKNAKAINHLEFQVGFPKTDLMSP